MERNCNGVIEAQRRPFGLALAYVREGKVKGQRKFEFADKAGKHVPVLAMLAHPGFAYNPKPIRATTIRSWKDFLQPRWKASSFIIK